MKKLLLTLLVVTISLFASGQSISHTYHFGQPSVKQIGEYQTLAFDGSVQNGTAGEPSLPWQSISLMLPPNTEAIYRSNETYPNKTFNNVSTQVLNGVSFAFGGFTPVRYKPAMGQVSYAQTVTVTVEYRVAALNDIYDAMSGRDNQEKIRNYIIQEYENCGISMVMFGGDVNLVPYRSLWCYAQEGYEDNIPSDSYYACLDGTLNDNDNELWGEIGEDDLLPELAVSRFIIPQGTHQLTWSYEKDGATVAGEDCVWVDNNVLPPMAVVLDADVNTADETLLYPNPTHGDFTLTLRHDSQVSVFNQVGQCVLNLGYVSGWQRLHLDAKGVYLVRICDKDGVKVMKVVVK